MGQYLDLSLLWIEEVFEVEIIKEIEVTQQQRQSRLWQKSFENLSKDLSMAYGKGFSLSNIKRMLQFYTLFPISATVSHQLNWSIIVELLKIDDPLERSFNEKQSIIENWSVR